MGRILETLKQAEAKRRPTAQGVSIPPSRRPGIEAASASEAEEIPFIEVGGPRHSTEASSSVLASGNGAKSKNSQAAMARPEPRTVELHPLPTALTALAPGCLAPDLIAYHQPEHSTSEQFRLLVTGIMAQLPLAGSQVVLFTALPSGTGVPPVRNTGGTPVPLSSPEVGATSVLLNVAITYAKQNKSQIAVVDVGAHYPSVAQLAEKLGLPPMPGLQEVLTGSVTLAGALQATAQENLLALTCGLTGTAGRAWPAREAMRTILRQLRKRFGFVLIDAPPWDGGPEILALGSACDAVYLVVHQSEAQSPAVAELVQAIPRHGSRLCGCIITSGA